MNIGMLLEMAVEGAGEREILGPEGGGLSATQLHEHARRAKARFSSENFFRTRRFFPDVNSGRSCRSRFLVPRSVDCRSLLFSIAWPTNSCARSSLGSRPSRSSPGPTRPAACVTLPTSITAGSPSSTAAWAPSRRRDREGGERSRAIGDGAVDADAAAVILFTSGTTGAAKAAVLRHRHLVSYVISTVEFMGAGDDEAQLVSVPPYHIAAISTILTSVYGGRRIVYLPTFDADLWVNTAATELISHAMVVPTMLGRILDLIEWRDARMPRLRHASYGGGTHAGRRIERAMRALPSRRRERVRTHRDQLRRSMCSALRAPSPACFADVRARSFDRLSTRCPD